MKINTRVITIAIFVIVAFSFSCAENGDNKTNANEGDSVVEDMDSGYVTEIPEDFEIPEEIDEETAIEITKYIYYTFGQMEEDRPQWNELQVMLIPIYDIYNNGKSYFGIVYMAEDEMPSLEVLKEQVREGYGAKIEIDELKSKKREEFLAKGIDKRPRYEDYGIPPELEIKRKLKSGIDSEKGTERGFYWSTQLSVKTKTISADIGSTARTSLPDILKYENEALKAVEDYTGMKPKFIGYAGSRLTGYWVKISAGNKIYYSRLMDGMVGVREEDEVKKNMITNWRN